MIRRCTFWLALALLLNVGALDAGGCKKKPQGAPLETARKSIEQLIHNMERNGTDAPEQRNLKAAYRAALTKIEGRRELRPDEVVLIVATINVAETPHGSRPGLSLQWLEAGDSVTGVYVEARGNVREFREVFAWNDKDREWFQGSAWRDTWIPIVVDKGSAEAWMKKKSRWQPINVAPEVISEPVRVGLITRHGIRSPSVDAYVEKLSDEQDATKTTATSPAP